MMNVVALEQFTGATLVTVTGDGPVMVNSAPDGVTELQFIASGNVTCIDEPTHEPTETVPMGSAGRGGTVKGTLTATGIALVQLSTSVFPSFPLVDVIK